MKNQKLAQMLKKKRIASNFSQADVAKRLRYSGPQYISNWERGVSAPPMDKLLEIISLYRMSRAELLDVMMEDTRNFLKARLNIIADKKEKWA